MRYLKVFAVIALLTAIPLTVHADGWTKIYGGDADEGDIMMEPTSDGGYIIVASTTSFGAGEYDIWLLKIDNNGDTLWTRTYGWVQRDRARSVQETQDGGFIIAGTTYRTLQYMWLIKTDPAGDTIWTEAYDEPSTDLSCMRQTPDQGYIIVYAASAAIGLMKTDPLGVVEWTRSYQGFNSSDVEDRPSCIQCTDDGGYVVTGYTSYYDDEFTHALWVFKTDASGDTVWSHIYGTVENWQEGNWIEQTSDGGYIVVGEREVPDQSKDLWLLKLDSSGDTVWTRTYGGEQDDAGSYVKEIPGGGYIITGKKGYLQPPQYDIWLLKTDAGGDTLWIRHYGYVDLEAGYYSSDYGTSVQQMSDGGYMIAGGTSRPETSNDIWILKTDENGIVGIEEEGFRSPSIELFSTIAPRITLRYSNLPQGFRADVFDASGRRVDVIRSTTPSGTVTWGEGQPSGVYFVRIPEDGNSILSRVVIIR